MSDNSPYEEQTLSDDIVGSHAHMMRSVEWQGGAFVEGFAHFLSTVAYNEVTEYNAYFKYYKQWTDPEPDYNYDTIDVEGNVANPAGGANDWLHSSDGARCPQQNMANCPYYGVEMDWLRHYWDFKTNDASGTPPDLEDILTHVALAYGTGYDNENVHDQLEAELGGTFLTLWDLSADANGADADPE